ncbi:MAG: hypothetical protein ACE5IR_27775 [bacterium]
MASNYTEFYMQLINGRTGKPVDDDSGVFNVLNAGLPTEATIFSDERGTSGSNPGTMTNGVIQFWIDSATTSVDISVMTSTGYAFFLDGITLSDHRIVLWPEGRTQRLVVPFTATTSETDTGFDFPANCVIRDVYQDTVTVDATETIDVGLLSSETGGDANGFLALSSVATAGLVTGQATVNNGSTSDYFDSGTYGVLMASQINGSDAAATSGGQIRKFYKTDGVAKSLTYTGSAGSDTAAGYIFVEYDAPIY